MTIKERFEEMREEFAGIASAKERLEVVLSQGEELTQARREEFTDDDKVPGCASEAYLSVSLREGKMTFKAFTTSLVIKGYAAILLKALEGSTPREILGARKDVESFIEDTGLDVSLIPSRTNSFSRLYEFIEKKTRMTRKH